MSPFVETLAIRDRNPCQLSFHQARFDRTRHEAFHDGPPLETISLERTLVPLLDKLPEGLVKLRILYGRDIEGLEWESYTRKTVRSLAIVHTSGLNYRFKYHDRSKLEELLARRGRADDILIVNNGYLSDASAANLVFEEGSRLITPTHCLLPGTTRARLLAEGRVSMEALTLADLPRFSRVHLTSAFRDLGDCVIELGTDTLIEGELACPSTAVK